MLSKEFKELIEITGGKIIISDGDPEKSFIIMKLDEYLKEKKTEDKTVSQPFSDDRKRGSTKKESAYLTERDTLDKMEAEIEDLYNKERERELEELIRAEEEEYSYERV
ncbi:MAG: hypothetical protein PHQ20_03915 [Candidatus Moranbacteria bacterium]|jgi:hypothetical protein|nr:hypothetical protein [Candidatus Moranbacteria bacterium]